MCDGGGLDLLREIFQPPLFNRSGFVSLLIEFCTEPLQQPIPFGADFLAQLCARLVPFLLPFRKTILVLAPQRLRIAPHLFCIRLRLLNGGLALGDDVHHGFIQKSVEDPDEDQKVNQFE